MNSTAATTATITKAEVGMVCTASFYSDRHVYDVIAVSPSGHRLTLRRRKAVMVEKPTFYPGGFAANVQGGKWKTESDPDGGIYTATRRRNGRGEEYYMLTGYTTSGLIHLGIDSYNYDYNF